MNKEFILVLLKIMGIKILTQIVKSIIKTIMFKKIAIAFKLVYRMFYIIIYKSTIIWPKIVPWKSLLFSTDFLNLENNSHWGTRHGMRHICFCSLRVSIQYHGYHTQIPSKTHFWVWVFIALQILKHIEFILFSHSLYSIITQRHEHWYLKQSNLAMSPIFNRLNTSSSIKNGFKCHFAIFFSKTSFIPLQCCRKSKHCRIQGVY